MRPVGGIRPVVAKVKVEPTDGAGKTHAIHLSVEAKEFSQGWIEESSDDSNGIGR